MLEAKTLRSLCGDPGAVDLINVLEEKFAPADLAAHDQHHVAIVQRIHLGGAAAGRWERMLLPPRAAVELEDQAVGFVHLRYQVTGCTCHFRPTGIACQAPD